MLRIKLRNERIYRAEATFLMKDIVKKEVLSNNDKNDYEAAKESHDQADKFIPQLEQAIDILTQWRVKS